MSQDTSRDDRRFLRSKSVYLFVFLSVLPLILFRDFTPSNELRYLSIADEALRDHLFWAFRNHGMDYADKPPLYLWLVMAGKWMFGIHSKLWLSLISLIPALLTVGVMDSWIKDLKPKVRENGRLLLLTCGLFAGTMVFLRMDMLMTLFITLSLKEFYDMEVLGKPHQKRVFLMAFYIFMAVFTKGPMGIAIPLCCIPAYLLVSKKPGRMARYWGWRTWIVLLPLFALWFGLTYLEGGTEYLNNLVFHQTAGRAVNSFHHARPFYYYLIVICYGFLPWTPVVVGGFIATLRNWKHADARDQFFCTTVLTSLLLLSVVSAKLAIYMLPVYPFLVYLTVIHMEEVVQARWYRISMAVTSALFCLAFPLFCIVAHLPKLEYINIGAFYPATLMLTVGGGVALYVLKRKRHAQALPSLSVCLLCAIFFGGFGVPDINAYLGYGDLCEQAAKAAKETGINHVATWHLRRPDNVDVYLKDVTLSILPDSIEAKDIHDMVVITRQRNLKHFAGDEYIPVGPNVVIIKKSE